MYRNICFTLNNYSQDDYDKLIGNKLFTYVIIGKEIGEQGTPHLQGYGELSTRSRLSTLKSRLGTKLHIEERRGNQQQATDYCKKENNWEERGIHRRQGIRTDLDCIRTRALDGGLSGISADATYQQIRIAEKFLEYNEEPRDWKPYVYWFWGPTGTGKSRTAHEIGGPEAYRKHNGDKWWPGYDGHEILIIDDFRDSWWSLTSMLSILDRYEHRVEVKGGYRQLKAKLIIITSAKPPNDMYKGTGEKLDQLIRRIDCIWKAQ